MTIKQHGGVFGRNPKFNNVEVGSLSIAGDAVPDASTILVDGDIGTTVQGYDADTAKYDDATANFTGTLQNGGSNVLVDTDIGSTVQGYDADTAKLDVAQTFTAAQTFNENIIFESGNGLDFSATGDGLGTATGELFDDYEVGEWTPEYRPGTGSFGSITYDAEVGGRYVKAGSLVHAFFRISTDALTVGTASSSLSIEGLPYTVINEPTSFNLGGTALDSIGNFAGENPSSAIPQRNSDIAVLLYKTAADGDTTLSDVSDLGTGANANRISGVIIYRAS